MTDTTCDTISNLSADDIANCKWLVDVLEQLKSLLDIDTVSLIDQTVPGYADKTGLNVTHSNTNVDLAATYECKFSSWETQACKNEYKAQRQLRDGLTLLNTINNIADDLAFGPYNRFLALIKDAGFGKSPNRHTFDHLTQDEVNFIKDNWEVRAALMLCSLVALVTLMSKSLV